jgi:hypothetical protein
VHLNPAAIVVAGFAVFVFAAGYYIALAGPRRRYSSAPAAQPRRPSPPNLDHLIQALQPWRSTVEMGARPLDETSSNPVGPVGAKQGLIVIGVWLAAFLVIALTSVVRRFDIKE